MTKHDEKTVSIARKLYEAQAPREHGMSPTASWAAAFYVAYQITEPGTPPTQASLAREYGCAPKTLRERRDDILAALV